MSNFVNFFNFWKICSFITFLKYEFSFSSPSFNFFFCIYYWRHFQSICTLLNFSNFRFNFVNFCLNVFFFFLELIFDCNKLLIELFSELAHLFAIFKRLRDTSLISIIFFLFEWSSINTLTKYWSVLIKEVTYFFHLWIVYFSLNCFFNLA